MFVNNNYPMGDDRRYYGSRFVHSSSIVNCRHCQYADIVEQDTYSRDKEILPVKYVCHQDIEHPRWVESSHYCGYAIPRDNLSLEDSGRIHLEDAIKLYTALAVNEDYSLNARKDFQQLGDWLSELASFRAVTQHNK